MSKLNKYSLLIIVVFEIFAFSWNSYQRWDIRGGNSLLDLLLNDDMFSWNFGLVYLGLPFYVTMKNKYPSIMQAKQLAWYCMKTALFLNAITIALVFLLSFTGLIGGGFGMLALTMFLVFGTALYAPGMFILSYIFFSLLKQNQLE